MARDLAHELAENDDGDSPAEACDYGCLNPGKSLLNRRSYLRLGAMAATAVATGAVSGTAGALTADDMSFDRVVNAVDDLGWDDSGGTPIDDSLADNFRDGTLIEVPPGTYRIDERHTPDELVNWGIRGLGDTPDEVRLTVRKGDPHRIFNIQKGRRNLLLENFTFDQREDWNTSIGNAFHVDDGLLIKDVVMGGTNPSEFNGGQTDLNVYVHDPDGVAVIDGFVRKGPTEFVEYPDNPMCSHVGSSSEGTVYYRNCHFQNCGEHGIYASHCTGDIRIENCFFKNNQNTHARISGEGSWVKDSVFVWDDDTDMNRGERESNTGMVFEAGYRGYAGGLAERCEFICETSPPNSGVLKVDGSHGSMTARDCRFYVTADNAEPLWADAPGDSSMIDGLPDKPWDLTIEGCSFTGGASSHQGFTGVIELAERPGTVIRNCCIDVGGDKDGIVLHDMSATVEDCSITVNGDATVFDNSTVETSNITSGEACPLPGEDTSSSDSTSGDPTTLPNTLSVHAPAGADAFAYSLTVTGDAEFVTSGEDPAEPAIDGGGDAIAQNPDSTTTITGIVADGGGDTFGYSGEVVAFAADGDPTVYRNGTEVAPADLGLPNWLVVTAPSGADAFEYEVTVSGDAELVTAGQYAARPTSDGGSETVTQNADGTTTVAGVVADGGGDTFTYDGAVTDCDAGGNPDVYRNGSTFDHTQFGLPNSLTLVADAGADAFDYAVTVSGDAELATSGAHPAEPASDGGGESVTQNADGTTTVAGRIAGGGGDSFDYDGEIVGFAAEGPLTVYRNGEAVSPAVLGLTEELTVTGLDNDSLASYEFTVTGDLAPNPDEGSFDSRDAISGSSAEGAVWTGTDSYLFSGTLADLSLNGNAEVYLNDELIDPADLGLDHEIQIQGAGVGTAAYTFSVDGSLVVNPDHPLEGEDAITGATASGTVTDDVDSYLFSGSVTDFALDGEAGVYVDGEQVDPEQLGSGSDPVLPNEFVIEAPGSSVSEYSLAVTGDVEKSPDLGSVETADVIDSGAITGSVDGDIDAYRFSGDITRLSVDGAAKVHFEDVDG